MGVEVFLLIRDLIENLRTSKYRTWEWFFISMDSQMIEEIVPFPKILPAVAIVTGEYTCESPCQGIRKFHLAKGLSVWDVNFLFEGR